MVKAFAFYDNRKRWEASFLDSIMIYIWLAIIILAVIVEAVTAQLVSIWFLAGGIAALIAGLCGAEIWLQVVLFALVTALVLIVTRPLVKRIMHFKKTDTNADRYIGKEGLVTETINNVEGTGRVTVLGSDWTARSSDDKQIAEGTPVLVERIEGVKLIVTPKQP